MRGRTAERLPAVERPVVLVGALTDLPALLATYGAQEVRFDAVVGRNALTKCADKTAALAQMHACLRPGGRLSRSPARGRDGEDMADTLLESWEDGQPDVPVEVQVEPPRAASRAD